MKTQIQPLSGPYNQFAQLKLLMSVQPNHCGPNNTLCKDCAVFYGSEAFSGLCSTCYKKTNVKKEAIVPQSPAETDTPQSVAQRELLESMEELSLQPAKREQKDKKRCFGCNKKTGLLGIECKCGFVYCNVHRLPQNHDCEFDHRNQAKERLKKQVIRVYNGKISQI